MNGISIRKVAAMELVAYVESRGYTATPVTNSTVAAAGVPLKVVGYELSGPRGSKTFLPKDKDDLLSLDAAALWADGVDYASSKAKPA